MVRMHALAKFGLLVILVCLQGCSSAKTHYLSLRIALNMIIDGEAQTLSETYSYRISESYSAINGLFGSARRINGKMTGEAIVIEGKQNTVFASFNIHASDPRYPTAQFNNPLRIIEQLHADLYKQTTERLKPDARFGAWIKALGTLDSPSMVPKQHWPALLAFADMSDKTTFFVVAPQDLSWATIEKVTIEVTQDQADIGDVPRVLPWFEVGHRGLLCLEERKADTSNRVASLPCTDFLKTAFVEVREEVTK